MRRTLIDGYSGPEGQVFVYQNYIESDMGGCVVLHRGVKEWSGVLCFDKATIRDNEAAIKNRVPIQVGDHIGCVDGLATLGPVDPVVLYGMINDAQRVFPTPSKVTVRLEFTGTGPCVIRGRGGE